MCHNPDSAPPVDGAPDRASGERIVLRSADGTEFAAFAAVGTGESRPGAVVLPDVRGLYPFYEQLAMRLAESGCDAVAIDYFGRTAGVGTRDDEFPFRDHVEQTTPEGVSADVAAAVALLRSDDEDRKVFTVGFCFGGSNSWLQAAERHGLAGVVGFYGNPLRPPVGPIDRVGDFECPVLALMGGDDPGIPFEVVDRFRREMDDAGVDNEVVVYDGAPHSFFDRKQADHAEAAADAWRRLLAFIDAHS
jgi:carboxymethylenebutenolidase